MPPVDHDAGNSVQSWRLHWALPQRRCILWTLLYVPSTVRLSPNDDEQKFSNFPAGIAAASFAHLNSVQPSQAWMSLPPVFSDLTIRFTLLRFICFSSLLLSIVRLTYTIRIAPDHVQLPRDTQLLFHVFIGPLVWSLASFTHHFARYVFHTLLPQTQLCCSVAYVVRMIVYLDPDSASTI